MQLNSLGNQLDEQDFLKEGDQITISYHNYYLYSQGFNTSELSLKNFQNRNPISSIFVIESFGRQSTKQFRKSTSLIHYGQKILLLHLLSGKYLSYEIHSSQEEVRLKYAKTSNCLFTIKPIFKCQANFARKIRKGQQICLESSERLKLCIELGQRQGIESECLVTMKKHEESIVLIDRLNLPHRQQNQLSNLMVCQLSNVQTQSTLYAEKKDQFYMQVFFAEDINLYGSFITIESYQLEAIKEILVVPNQILCIQFYTSGLFLGFDQNEQIQLYSECRDQCRFMFQNYDQDELKEESIIKVKHINSGLYLGADKKQVTLGPFQLNKTFRLKRVDYSMLKITLLVNELHASFVSLLREKVIMEHRLQLQQLFKELLRFIYLPNFNQEHYYTLDTIKLKITAIEQNLLSKVGFIQLFITAYRQFLGLLNNGGIEHKTQSHLAISQIMLVLVGICHRNKQNTEVLCHHLPVLYEGISMASQIIDALFHIFHGDNLGMLESKEHHNKKGKIRSIDLLIESIQRQRVWEVSVRAKLLRFLESIMIRNEDEKWVLHEISVMQALRGDRLRNVLYSMTVVGEDIQVCLEDGKYELSDILMKKTKYSKEIDVIRAQLNFLCTLYSNPNVFYLTLFRQQFPENVLFNYLKNNIPAEDHRIFLRMLNEIYLRILPKVSSNIVFLMPAPELRQRQNELKSLQKIKTIVVGKVKRSIDNELIDEATQLSVRAVQRYSQLGLIELNEWNQLLQLMQNFLLKNYRFSTNDQEGINLNLQILKLHEFVAEVNIDYFAKQLILNLKEEIPKVDNRRFVKTTEAVFAQILREAEFSQQDRNRFRFLQKVIDHSVENAPNIFHTACRLMKLVNHRPYRLVERLKSLILIDSAETQAMVVELHQHHLDLGDILGEYQQAQKRERQLVEISFSLTKKMQAINLYFYRWNSKQSHDSISPLVQNIMREIGIFSTVMSFPKDQQRQLGTKRSNIFMELFTFIQLYLHNNETNLLACIREFQSIKWLFTYEDVGQTKILFLLISNPISLKTLPFDLKVAALASVRHSEMPNCYGVLSILKVIHNGGLVDQQYVCEIAHSFVSESGLLQKYWKINQLGEFIYQEESRQDQKYFKYFGYYIFLIIRLFLVLIQYCDCKDELIKLLKEKIRLKILIELMLQKDLLDQQCSLREWGLQIMKEQFISFYEKIYENYFENVGAQQIKYFIDKATQINNRLMSFKNLEEIKIPQFVFTENDVESLQNECLKLKFKENQTPTIHLILICTMYPFLLEFTHQLYLCGNSSQQTQIQSLWMQFFRRLKELLSALTIEEYRKFKKEYNCAISACEQILKNKLGFYLEEEENQQSQKQAYAPINKIYRVEQLHNLLDNCQVLNDTDPKSPALPIYKAIFVILYSPYIHQIIIKKSRIVNPLKGEQALGKIVKVFLKSMQNGLIKGKECIQIFWLLAKEHNHLMKFIMTSDNTIFQEMIILALTSDTDNSNTVLNSCMKVCNLMMKQLIDAQQTLKSNIFTHSTIIPSRQVLNDRIRCVLQRERLLYDHHSFEDYLQQCEANNLLNSEWIPGSSLVENILQFIANAFIIAGNIPKDVNLFKEVLLLFRSYLRFVNEFNLVYMPLELHSKISKCLQIIFNALSTSQQEISTILFEGAYYEQFNRLLKLDDSWDVQNLEVDLTKEQYLTSIFTKLKRGWQKDWIQKLIHICIKSNEFYGESITYGWGGFPLQPMLSLYGPLKRGVVLILKQLKILGLPSTKQILLGMNGEILKQNIINIYNKHYFLFKRFHLPSLDATLKYPENHRLHNLAAALCFQNGIDLTSLKMYIDTLSDHTLLSSKYSKYCENLRSFRGVISQFGQFLDDFRGLFWGSEEQFQTKNVQYKIYEYFYSRMGRVELLVGGKLITVDFLIRPECIVHSSDRESLMGELNFISTQLKLSSLSKSAMKFHLLFNQYNKFLTRYRNIKIILFLQKYLILIKIINLLLIYLDNIYLLTNSENFEEDNFYTEFDIADAFQILLLINFLLTVVYLLIYNLKNLPIMLAQLKENMQEQNKRFHKYSQLWTKLVLAREILFDSQFIYNLVYLVVMGLVFVNKIVIALLTLDLLIQLRQMRELLLTLWKAKGQLLFAFIYFTLIHYFYVIFAYLVLKNIAGKYCDIISDCLGSVFVLSLRVVGGFPGYIYQQQVLHGVPPSLDIYSLFGDIYLIISYQIFSAVIIVIIVDSYSKLSRRKTQQKESLSLNCLVCGLSRTIFNASSKLNFRTHVAVDHNVWNYIYYFHYLKSKPQAERNFNERLMMETSMPEWLPNGYSQGFQEPN